MKTSDGQDIKKQSPKLQRKTSAEEEQVQRPVQAKEKDVAQLLLSSPSQSIAVSEPESSAVRDNDGMMTDVLQQNVDKLVLIQKRAEMAEEEAQSYEKLLDDSNNRLKKLQMDMETERINMRHKSEDLQLEALNMKQTINDLQEEIRSLQRATSSLQQNTLFQSTEVEGLKEQLKITQGELQKKGSMEQDNILKVNNLEEEVASKQTVLDQLKLKCNELTGMNVSSDRDIRGLKIQTESLEKERSFSEQKIKLLKSEIESWKQQLQAAKEETNVNKRTEQALQLKCLNLEAALQKSELVASQLQKRVDELKPIHLEMEHNLKNVRADLDQMTMAINSKDQQINIFKSQVEGTKSQVRIIEEELNKKSQTSHELQLKLQDYSEEVRKKTELQQKINTLNSKIANFEKEITTLKSEQKVVFADKNSANIKICMQHAEINDLNITLKKRNAELQKESDESKTYLNKVKTLEDELFKHKQSSKGLSTSSPEKMSANLKQEMCVLQNDKRAADRNVEILNAKVSELSSYLQRTKDELLKETRERKVKESKVLQMETELHVTMKESMSRSNLQHENMMLQKEKAEVLEKSISLGSEVRRLKEHLQGIQKEAEQKQKQNSVLQLRSQEMEEQLEKCKKMLEELKSKLELHKEGYERQLLLVQTEVEKKLILLQSEITSERGNSQRQPHSAELLEMLNKYFKQDVTMMKTVHQTDVERKQQSDQQLQTKMNKLQQVNTKLEHDLSKAKSQITQHEEDGLRLHSKGSALQSLCNEKQIDTAKLTDSKLNLALKGNEDRALREQIQAYVEEVKSLQEKLRVQMKTENQKVNKQEVIETSSNYVKENEAASLKTEHTLRQKMVPSYKSAQYIMQDEILKMEVSPEVWMKLVQHYCIILLYL
ncbi:myosin heavy chain-like [Pseudoliparis swirei]|uniref:myosin heavy chain-like n=1 Tax=Pseudoliparis swirei TaxID=2059687 RepID=UPI0024BECE77|nr:myosin heavy chain-like [Pseudoliparis swirei]